jgi:glycerol-1-phosphate dehydrogenase [NAD(P)+]
MKSDLPIFIGPEVLTRLVPFCQSRGLRRFLLVADGNTYDALGRRVETTLKEQGWHVRTALLNGGEVLADERRVFDVLFHADGQELTYLAVGSGTVTDITRYASYCARNPFISLPTAPSVDAYASGGAALTMGGYKLTVPGQAPLAILADLPTLRAAPRAMIAAGFGDMLGKYSSLADWRLGALLLDEAYNVEIAARAERALLECVAQASQIGSATEAGILTLMEGLLESGLCMTELGSSRPASGSEHLLSHFWELRRMHEGLPALLHGAKVGVGTVLAAQRYAALRGLTRQEAVDRLAAAPQPSQEEEIARIRRTYGTVAERIIANHLPFLQRMEANAQMVRRRIKERWAEVQAIAASVPPPHVIVELLNRVGAPSDPQALGLSQEYVPQALQSSRYLRARFTVDTLGRLMGLW